MGLVPGCTLCAVACQHASTGSDCGRVLRDGAIANDRPAASCPDTAVATGDDEVAKQKTALDDEVAEQKAQEEAAAKLKTAVDEEIAKQKAADEATRTKLSRIAKKQRQRPLTS